MNPAGFILTLKSVYGAPLLARHLWELWHPFDDGAFIPVGTPLPALGVQRP